MMRCAVKNAYTRLLCSAGVLAALWTLLAAAVCRGGALYSTLALWGAGLAVMGFGAARFWRLLAGTGVLEDGIRQRELLLQQQLKDQEERFRQAAENLDLVFWIASPDMGRVFYANDAYRQVWQRSCASMLQEPLSWLEAVAPEDRPAVQACIHDVTHGDFSDSRHLECRILSGDGAQRWVQLQFIPVCSSDGKIVRIIACAEDSTRRRHAEQELRHLQRQLDETQELAGIGTWEICFPGPEVHWSAQLYRILGYDPGAVKARDDLFVEHVHPDDRDDYLQLRHDYSPGIRVGEFRITASDGSLRQVSGSARIEYDEAGNLSRMYGTIQDITGRKETENALRASQSRYHDLFAAMQEGFALYELTADGLAGPAACRLVDINPAFESLTGRTRDTVLGRSLAELYPDLDRQWTDMLGRVARTGEAKRFESSSPDGSRYYSIYAYQPRHLQVAVIFSDITSQKQAEMLLKKNESRLDSLYRLSKQTFASEAELISFALDEAVTLTESRVGYLHILADGAGIAEGTSWSGGARELCRTGEPRVGHCLARAGLWADSIRESRPLIHTGEDLAARGCHFPPGHIDIASHMSTPVFENGRIAAVAGVANKQAPYEEADIRQLHLFMDGLWRELARRRAEQQLVRANAALEEKVSQRAAELEAKNEQLREENRRRAKALADLAESEIRFSQTAELVREVIWEVDAEGLFTYLSSACLSVWGYGDDELKGRRCIYDLHQEQGREEFKNALLAIFQRREFFRGFLSTVRTKSGQVRLMSTSGMPLFDPAGGFEGYRGLSADITEEMQAQEQLRTASSYNRNFIETSLDFIAVAGVDGAVTDVNNAMENATGMGRDELRGSELALHFTAPERVRDVLGQVLREGYVRNCSLEIRHSSGTVTPVLCNASLYRDVNGEPAGIFVTVRDITEHRRTEAELEAHRSRLEGIVEKRTQELMNEINERRRAEEDLRQMNLHLRETTAYAREMALQAELANTAKSEFLANMSHEIRTPMNAVLGLSHLAQQAGLSPRQKEYLTKLDAAAASLLTIINDILDFSKIEAGKLELQPSAFDLTSVFDNLSSILSLRAQEKGIELLFDIGFSTPFFLEGDWLRLQQVLVNLAGNAIKFTEQGEVVVSVQTVERDDSGASLRFTVRDTGIGIQPEEQHSLFQPFTQADTTMTRKFGGTGLGLAISRRLVELMGGQLTVASEPGRGSVFQFVVPFGLCEAGSDAERPETHLGDKRVLVVDDSDTVRDVLEKMLEAMGLRVDTAGTGAECLARLQHPGSRVAYDLIIADWKMPGMDGVELVGTIKERTGAARPRILMITGYGADDLKAASEGLEIDGWLEKPVTLVALSAAVAHCLGTSAKSRQPDVLQQPDEPAAVAGRRVLLVEDNELNRQVAGEILAGAGVQVSYAGNGIEAVAAVKDGRFDAVLMDVQMPLMDGRTAAEKIRQWEKKIGRQQRIPIIAMTAHAFRDEYEKSIQSGMDDHLTKPINAADLLSVLGTWTAEDGLRLSEAERPPGAHPAVEPQLDTAAALARIDGNLELYVKILKVYKSSLPSADDILRHFRQGDVQAAQRQAHTAKGMSSQIGAAGLHAIAAALEEAIRSGDRAAVEKHAARFVEKLKDALACIDRFIGNAENIN